MPTSSTDFKHPYCEEMYKIESLSKRPDFFTGENSFRMNHVSLGEALDFVSVGGMNYCYWDITVRQLTDFIKQWTDVQEPRINLIRVPIGDGVYRIEEKSREYSYLWNKFDRDFDGELPFIHRDSCPAGKGHKRTGKDLTGRVICLHADIKKFRPSYLQDVTFSDDECHFWEEEPNEPVFEESDYDGNGELIPKAQKRQEKHMEEKERYANEEPTERVVYPCLAIISEKGTYLPLEKVLRRLNVFDKDNGCAFPFSGFTLANYVKSWWNQSGEKGFYMPEGEADSYKAFPGFVPVNSED
jgi:hypothetical protein